MLVSFVCSIFLQILWVVFCFKGVLKAFLKFRTGETALIYLEDKTGLKYLIDEIKRPGDTFLVKASHSMGFETIVSGFNL